MSGLTGRSASSWLILSVFVILADQLTKWIAVSNMALYESISVMPMLNWTLLHNYGAAFSFLSDQPGWQRWFFTILAFVITTILIVWLRRTPRDDWKQALPLALIIGGAIGNVIDRMRFGYVVDFIDVYYQSWHWPAFNIADSAISVGAVALILLSFRSEPAEPDAGKPDGS